MPQVTGKPHQGNQARKWLGLLTLGLLGSCTTVLEPNWVRAENLGERKTSGGIAEKFNLQWDKKQENMIVHIERSGPVSRPTLGLTCATLTAAVAAKRGVQPYSGILVTGIADGSAARGAGLRAEEPGDVLIALDGTPLVSVNQFDTDFQTRKVGEAVKLQILRGQTKMEVALVVGEVTETRALPVEDIVVDKLQSKDLGADFNLVELPEELSERVYGSRERMILVRSVQPQSAAWNAGLRPWDRLKTMNGMGGKDVPTLAQIAGKAMDLVASGENFVITVQPNPAVGTAKDSAPITVSFAPGTTKRTRWELWVPFVHYQESGSYWSDYPWGFDDGNSYWSVGPLDMLASNYHAEGHAFDRSNGDYCHNVFYALLGLIKVETGTGPTKVRLLWFLNF